ncbi:MAG: TrkA C-terminal domain-containing protein [Microthrixaceae bacterium]
MIAVFSLLIIVLVGLIITRIATAALVSTGLSRESARFQARSAFTGAGFTTSESEGVVGHLVRRRVVMTLMLLGNAGIATVVAGLLLGLGGAQQTSGLALRIGILAAGLTAIFLLSRSRWVDQRLRGFIAGPASHHRHRGSRLRPDPARGGRVRHRRAARGERGLDVRADPRAAPPARRGVVVLGIERRDRYLGTPSSETLLEAGDTLVVYGRRDVIRDLDRRRGGTLGQLAHSERSSEQSQVRTKDAQEWTATEPAEVEGDGSD